MANNSMYTEKKSARFDVRVWNEKLPKEQWRIAADEDNIKCTMTYALAELPAQYKKADGTPDEFVRLYQSRDAKAANAPADRAAITFKVGANCKWHDKFGKECKRPANADLEGKDFEVVIFYSRKERNPEKQTSPCGYWANGIMYRELAGEMFKGMEMEKDETPDDEPQPMTAPTPAEQPAKGGASAEEVDLPF